MPTMRKLETIPLFYIRTENRASKAISYARSSLWSNRWNSVWLKSDWFGFAKRQNDVVLLKNYK